MGMVYKENQQNSNRTKLNLITVLNKIPCFYTNADQFRRKFPEFSISVQNKQQMLIAVTEVKPEHSIDKLFPAEFSIDHIGDYDSPLHRNITNGTGRGILLYAHKQHHPATTTKQQCIKILSQRVQHRGFVLSG